jgi:LPS-assembly protein
MLFADAVAAQPPACPVPAARVASRPEASERREDEPVEVRAQRIRAEKDGVVELEGAAEISKGTDRVSAERMRYNTITELVTAEGPVRYSTSLGDSFSTEYLKLHLNTDVGETGFSRYSIRDGFARGDAARIEFQGPEQTVLSDLRYTTCREGTDDWFLNIGTLQLDNGEDIGTARNTTVDFLGIPIFYFPYVSFPISDRRKSGFLFPRVGHSDRLGYEIEAPYYFNLAPNYDATLAPSVLTERGLQLQSEFRYLTREGGGAAALDVLPNDRIAEDDRAVGMFRHYQTLNRFWSANVDVRAASDKDYFEDFGDRLSITSLSYLTQNADLNYRGSDWIFLARLADYQTIDRLITPAQEPYARLPQLRLRSTARVRPNQLTTQLDTEWNRFDHEVNLTGERLNLNTAVSLPLQNAWGFLTPKVGARYIGYNLDRDTEETPALVRGVFSLDSGLLLERDTRWDERAFVQTLEPRLFYLYVPPKNQDALPNFDSGVPDLTFAGLFRDNRFVGGDRIGDANQITAAVSTRFLDLEEGVERLRLSLGRIYYFDDLEVNLPAAVQTAAWSDYVAEASAWLIGNWHARETLQWSGAHHRTERNSFYLQYQPAANKIVSLGHVYIRDQLGQIDLAADWPVTPRWSVRGRSLYSTQEKHSLDTYVGVEYNACCWALRLTASRRWELTEQVNAVALELQLVGLSKLGSAPDSPLKQGLFFPFEESRSNPFYD